MMTTTEKISHGSPFVGMYIVKFKEGVRSWALAQKTRKERQFFIVIDYVFNFLKKMRNKELLILEKLGERNKSWKNCSLAIPTPSHNFRKLFLNLLLKEPICSSVFLKMGWSEFDLIEIKNLKTF